MRDGYVQSGCGCTVLYAVRDMIHSQFTAAVHSAGCVIATAPAVQQCPVSAAEALKGAGDSSYIFDQR